MNEPFTCSSAWNRQRPLALVVACSDGRLQENLDEFLQKRLAITRYDRLYAPGGPGALASSGVEYLRSDQFRREAEFLAVAHAVEAVYLIFHGPAPDGPDEALCADYRRIFPNWEASRIREQQERDLDEICRRGFGGLHTIPIHAFRCEIDAAGTIRFREMSAAT